LASAARGLRRPLEAAFDAGRQSEPLRRRLDGPHRVAERRARRQVERERHRRELSLTADRDRRRFLGRGAERAERHGAAVGAAHVETVEARGGLPEVRLHLQHDAVLVHLREDRGHLPLAERVVERVVQYLRADAEPRGGAPVDRDRRADTVIL